MKDIKIKSYPNGITVYIPEEMSYEEILVSVRNKFTENAKFFGNVSLCLSFSGKELTEDEEAYITDIIEGVTQIHVVCILNNEDTYYSRKLGRLIDKAGGKDPKQEFYKLVLNNDQKEIQFIELLDTTPKKLKVSSDCVILGNLNKAYSIKASGNVYVFGKILGKLEVSENSRVIALGCEAEKLSFNHNEYKAKKGLFKKNSNAPLLFTLSENEVICEEIKDVSIFDIIFR